MNSFALSLALKQRLGQLGHHHIDHNAPCIYTWVFENRVSKNINSFYFLAISNNKTHSKAD